MALKCPQGIKGQGMAGTIDTLASLWPPLVIIAHVHHWTLYYEAGDFLLSSPHLKGSSVYDWQNWTLEAKNRSLQTFIDDIGNLAMSALSRHAV
jgi:hypothetical protein